MSMAIYMDNVGDVYLIPESLEPIISDFDNLVTDSVGTDLHNMLVDVWEEYMGKWRYKGG